MAMASIVTMDRAGRILLPANARKEMRVRPGSKFLITEMENGRLVLTPLDMEQLARQIQKEMEGFDVDGALEQIRQEMQDLAEKRYPELARRMKKRR